MNTFHSLTVQQSGNQYRIWTPQGICVAHIIMPPDGQYMMDSKILDIMCKALALRWGVEKKQK